MSLAGKTVLITGAGSGMGRLAAQRHAAAGARVAAWDLNAAGLEETAAGHEQIYTRQIDVTDRQAMEAGVKDVVTQLGPIDRVFAAAGIMPTSLLLEHDLDEIQRIMAVNYNGVVHTVMTTLPAMLERSRGDMVIFASMAGVVPTLHFGAYDASKAAVVAFSEVLYHENRGRGVRFAIVCPQLVDTPLKEQATSKPKLMQAAKLIPPSLVLDDIEHSLEKGRLFVFPGWQSKAGVWMRRLAPSLLWQIGHRSEGI